MSIVGFSDLCFMETSLSQSHEDWYNEAESATDSKPVMRCFSSAFAHYRVAIPSTAIRSTFSPIIRRNKDTPSLNSHRLEAVS